jgi:hypothetical protein
MLPAMPIIGFGPNGPNMEQIRREEPIFFITILAASASILRSTEMFEKLQKEAASLIAYHAVVEAEKTPELLLALLLLTFWSIAPPR